MNMGRKAVFLVMAMLALGACRLTLGAGTGIGNGGHLGTSVTVDPATGDVDTSVGASVTVR